MTPTDKANTDDCCWGCQGASTTQRTTDNEGMLDRRDSLPQRRARQVFIQYQMVNPGNTHTSNTIQTQQVVFMYL